MTSDLSQKERKLKDHGREVGEWIGPHPDAKVPPHVRARVFQRCGGMCHLAKRKITAGEPWDLDHIKALEDGGEHRESNLAPALKDKHREKTAAENSQRAIERRKFNKHHGVKSEKRSGFRGWRNMRGEIVWRDEK